MRIALGFILTPTHLSSDTLPNLVKFQGLNTQNIFYFWPERHNIWAKSTKCVVLLWWWQYPVNITCSHWITTVVSDMIWVVLLCSLLYWSMHSWLLVLLNPVELRCTCCKWKMCFTFSYFSTLKFKKIPFSDIFARPLASPPQFSHPGYCPAVLLSTMGRKLIFKTYSLRTFCHGRLTGTISNKYLLQRQTAVTADFFKRTVLDVPSAFISGTLTMVAHSNSLQK